MDEHHDHLARHLHLNHHHAMIRRMAHEHGHLPPAADGPTPTVVQANLVPRDTSNSICTDTTSPGCAPTSAPAASGPPTSTIIGVSVALPLVAAIVVLYFLHRRTVKRQAAEDARDAQADLDFGIDPKYKNMDMGKGKKLNRKPVPGKGGPEMQDADFEKKVRQGYHGTGMSIDLGNPYILPPEVNGSRSSLTSLTRSLHDNQDPYRLVGKASSQRGFNDAGSIMSASDRGLLSNPAPMSRSMSQQPSQASQSPAASGPVAMPTFDFTDHTAQDTRTSHISHASHASHKSVDVGAANRLSNQDKSLPATPQDAALTTPPPRGASLGDKSPYAATNNAGPVDPYSFQEVVVPPSPTSEHRYSAENGGAHPDYDANSFPYPPPPDPTNENRKTLGLGLDLAGNRLSVVRPLPPDDPNDTAESRANRIRSFYKEYFADDTAHTYEAGIMEYYEDYGDEYLQDGAIFDPETGQFIVAQAPYADPITRRAMTPPPRGPPAKFRGGPGGPRRPGHISQGSSPGMGPGPRGRAFSNASYSRNGPGFGPRGKGPGKKPLPPPSALHNLPTAHLLTDDSLLLAADFAPPKSYRDRAAGRSETPLLEDRPYSPQVPIANSPLASAFTELAVVPSPHMLRKSGTFTALDFVPPPRFKDPEAASDAGSIRSGRSNFSSVSSRQQHAIRAGAYRLSRVPKSLVGTKDDLADSLKPQWKMGT